MKARKTFHLSINTNEQCIFVLLKNTAELRNHEINQFTSKKTFKIFQARKRLAENFVFYVTQSFRLLCSKYWVTFVHFCGVKFLRFLRHSQRSTKNVPANKIIKRSQKFNAEKWTPRSIYVSKISLLKINSNWVSLAWIIALTKTKLS